MSLIISYSGRLSLSMNASDDVILNGNSVDVEAPLSRAKVLGRRFFWGWLFSALFQKTENMVEKI